MHNQIAKNIGHQYECFRSYQQSVGMLQEPIFLPIFLPILTESYLIFFLLIGSTLVSQVQCCNVAELGGPLINATRSHANTRVFFGPAQMQIYCLGQSSESLYCTLQMIQVLQEN